MIVLSIMMVAWLFWYSRCIKIMTLPEGYTIYQAVVFYRSCVKLGVNIFDDVKTNYELLLGVSQEKGITTALDEEALWKLYCDGKEINSFIRLKLKNNNKESEDYNE